MREDASPNSNSLLESPPGKVYSPQEHSIAKFEERHEQHRLVDRQASRQLMPFPMIQGRTLLTNQQFGLHPCLPPVRNRLGGGFVSFALEIPFSPVSSPSIFPLAFEVRFLSLY